MLFSTLGGDLSPLPTEPSPADLAEPGAKFLSAMTFNKALSYAAGRPNVMGGIGLLNPFKSSVFRNLMGLSEKLGDAAPEVNAVYATGHAVINASVAAYNGECN